MQTGRRRFDFDYRAGDKRAGRIGYSAVNCGPVLRKRGQS